MKQRVDVGTDVGMLGVWDRACEAIDFSDLSAKEAGALLNADADSGDLFLIELGADWGGVADVYVNASMESEAREQMKPVGGECLVSSPSGRLVVGGVEDYRSAEAKITSASSVVAVSPGDYGIRCFVAAEEDAEVHDMPEPAVLEAAMGSERYAHFQRWNGRSTKGFWLLLLFFPITYWIGWIVGVFATVAMVIGFFHLVEWLQNRDPRYVEAHAAFEAALRAYRADSPSVIALTLRGPLKDHQLSGGRVDISGAQ